MKSPVACMAPTRRTVPAAITDFATNPFPGMSGRRIVVDLVGLCWPHNSAGDVLEVDFDARAYEGDGYYILRLGGDLPWTGGRMLCREATGLVIREPVAHDGWEWRDFTPEQEARIQIVGRVHEIYRRASSEGKRHG